MATSDRVRGLCQDYDTWDPFLDLDDVKALYLLHQASWLPDRFLVLTNLD